MIMLTNVSFQNKLGGQAAIFYKQQGELRGGTQELANLEVGAPINGNLFMIDFVNTGDQYTCNFTVLPDALWVQKESPYVLDLILDQDQRPRMRVRDNRHRAIGDFPIVLA